MFHLKQRSYLERGINMKKLTAEEQSLLGSTIAILQRVGSKDYTLENLSKLTEIPVDKLEGLKVGRLVSVERREYGDEL